MKPNIELMKELIRVFDLGPGVQTITMEVDARSPVVRLTVKKVISPEPADAGAIGRVADKVSYTVSNEWVTLTPAG